MTTKEFLEQSSGFAGTSGYAWDSPEALMYFNRARRLIWNRGDYEGLLEYGCIKVDGCEFFLPYHLETLRAAWPLKYGAQVDLVGRYYERIERAFLDSCCDVGCDKYTATKRGDNFAFPSSKLYNGITAFFQILDTEDENVTIEVFAEDDKKSVTSEKLTLVKPFEYYQLEVSLGKFLSLRKPRTFGRVRVLLYEDNKNEHFLEHFLEPFETNSKYSLYNISPNPSGNMVILAKKRYYTYSEKDYDKEIDINPDALEFAMAAVVKKETDNDDGYVSKVQLTEEHLEEEQQDKASSAGSVGSTFFPSII